LELWNSFICAACSNEYRCPQPFSFFRVRAFARGGCYVGESIREPMYCRACPSTSQEISTCLGSTFRKRTCPIQCLVVTEEPLSDKKELYNGRVVSQLVDLLV
jgi:hypothetical protein